MIQEGWNPERLLQNFLWYSMSLSFVIWNVSILLWGLQKGLLFGLSLKFSAIHAAKFAMNKKLFIIKSWQIAYPWLPVKYIIMFYCILLRYFQQTVFSNQQTNSLIFIEIYMLLFPINEPSLVSMVWSLIILWRGEMTMMLSRHPFN